MKAVSCTHSVRPEFLLPGAEFACLLPTFWCAGVVGTLTPGQRVEGFQDYPDWILLRGYWGQSDAWLEGFTSRRTTGERWIRAGVHGTLTPRAFAKHFQTVQCAFFVIQ